MAASLTKARSQITKVSTFLKQEKLLPAASSLYEALISMLKTQLMKAEKDEFARMIADAVYTLNNDANLRKVYPLTLNYVPGEEKELAESLRELVNALQDSAVDEAKEKISDIKERKEAGLKEGMALIVENRVDDARRLLEKLAHEFPKDSELKAQIADLFIKGELFEDAFQYLDQALEMSPDQIHLYNRIGIVLRKLKKFEIAEKYFMRAVGYAKNDANLYFNLGRVYVDWQRFDKVEKASRLALRLKPDFLEARKMLNFALKRQDKPQEA